MNENYIGKKVIIKNNLYDDEEENIICYKNTEAIIDSIEIKLDGFGTDYVNIITDYGLLLTGISTYELELV